MKNKKLILAFTFLFSAFVSNAEIHKPHRIVELAVETNVGVSNNLAKATDFLVKDLVIDLTKISNDMFKKGFVFEFSADEKNSLSINANKYFSLGFFANVNGCGEFSIGRDFFDIFGKGYNIGDTKEINIDSYAELYVDAGVSFKTKISDFGVRITPSYYVPLVYVPNTKGSMTLSSKDSGKITMDAKANIDIYSAANLKKLFGGKDDDDDENNGNNEDDGDFDLPQDLLDSLSNGGVALSLGVETDLLGKELEVGAFMQIPITPGKLNYEMKKSITASMQTSDNGIIDFINDNKPEFDSDFGDSEYFEVSKKYFKPFKIGAECVYRPFGKWFEVSPMVALVVRSPYTSDASVYGEYFIPASVNLKNILGFTLATGYLNKAFVHQFSFMLNARVLELDFGASLRSSHFVKSFGLAGTTAFFAIKLGF